MDAFLIIGFLVDPVPDFYLVHGSRICSHVRNDVGDHFTEVTFTSCASFYKPQLCGVTVEPLNDLSSITSTINVQLGVGQFSVVKEPVRSMHFVIHKLTLTFALTFEVHHFLVQLVILSSISSKCRNTNSSTLLVPP